MALFVVNNTHGWTDDVATPTSTETSLKKLSLEDLMRMEVTSVSRQESTVGQSPAAIFVVTPEMIRRSGATNFPELLRMVPGLEVGHIDSSKWGVAARGFNTRFANQLLVQVDGRTVYTPINGGVYWDTVDYPLDDIDRIEVIRGPGGSVWGANAVNGIINIITKSAKETQGVSWTAGGGTEERAFTSFRFGGAVGDNLYYRVYGKCMDARLAWEARKNLELALVGQNLFDDHHPELGTSLLIRSPLVEVERSIYGIIKWEF